MLFVMTSRVESFGIIALESMRFHCHIISSTSPCLPEIYGNQVQFYEPYNVFELADKIQESLDLTKKLDKPVYKASYFWHDTFTQTFNLFEGLINNYRKNN
jgi:glycosyltransferase involved in cell wall biosynthesis